MSSHDPASPHLILIPGLGVGAGLYLPQHDIPARLEVPPWLKPEPDESLESFGKRMAATIDPHDAIYLGGVSFGGLVALEMAKHLPARGVFLLATVRSPRQFPFWFGAIALAARLTPVPLLRLVRWSSPLVIRLAGRFDRDQRDLATRVVRAMDIDLARWSLRAMMRWKGELPRRVPIHAINGTHDWILPPEYVRPDAWVSGGGHLMNIQCPRAVNRFITERLTPAASQASAPNATCASKC